MSISLATSRACLVSSDKFPSEASSIIWKKQRKNAQNSDKLTYHILRLNNIWFLPYDNSIKLKYFPYFSNWCLAGWYEKFITCFDCYHMPFRNVITWHSGDTRHIPENKPQCYVFSEKHYKVVYKTIIWILESMIV